MFAQLLKKTLFSRIISFVVAFSFILTSVPVSYASIVRSDSLRITPATRGNSLQEEIKGDLAKRTNPEKIDPLKNLPKTKVAINGFGRIGKLVLKAYLENPDNRFNIVAVNDLDTIGNLAHLFRHDSTFGAFKGKVEVEGDTLIINGQRIKVLSEKDPAKLPWKDLGVEMVIEATGKFSKRELASKHLEAGAKKVVLTAPGENEDLTVVLGIDEDKYDPEKHQIISNASCTTNCLTPLTKVLNKAFGIELASMVTIHAATNDQLVLDAPHKDRRRARATLGNIIPTTTGAAKAAGKVIPELQGKIDGLAFRVPTPNVSVVYLTALLKKEVTKEEVNAVLKKASEDGYLGKYLGYTEEELVSSDFLGNDKSSTVDASLTKVIGGKLVTIIAWYDNEWGYSNRTVDLVNYMLGRTEERAVRGAAGSDSIEIAQKLGVDVNEYHGFVNNDITIHNAQGGRAFGTFTDDVLKYLQTLSSEALKNMKTQVIIVDPNFFRAGGVKSALETVAKLSRVVRIALYGESAEKIKTLIGNENVITAKDIETLYSVLLDMDVGNAIVLRSQDELPNNVKLLVQTAGDAQIVSSQLPTLAIAKALKELLSVKEIDDAFEKFLGQIKTDNVISEQAYNSNHADLLAKLKEGQIFEFSPDLKPAPAVTEKTEVEAARKKCEEFLTKIGV